MTTQPLPVPQPEEDSAAFRVADHLDKLLLVVLIVIFNIFLACFLHFHAMDIVVQFVIQTISNLVGALIAVITGRRPK